jgi:hypothetical protein
MCPPSPPPPQPPPHAVHFCPLLIWTADASFAAAIASAAVAKAAAPRANAFATLQGDETSTAASLDAAAKASAKVSKAKQPRKVAAFPTKAVDPAFADITFKELKPLDALSFLPKSK